MHLVAVPIPPWTLLDSSSLRSRAPMRLRTLLLFWNDIQTSFDFDMDQAVRATLRRPAALLRKCFL